MKLPSHHQPLQKAHQRGISLLTTLIFLVLLTLLGISAFNSSTTNVRIVGNTQVRQEAFAAAQQAVEQTISSSAFAVTPDAVAASPVLVDIDGDGVTDYTAQLTPQPNCYRATTIKTSDLNPALASDLSCMGSGTVQNSGLDTADAAQFAGNSLCANTEWNVRAQVVHTPTATKVAVNQGVALRVLVSDASNSCN
jgi:hypothetical protein